ncbi:MAG: hypothetical protein ABWY06_04590 [Pseudomonas sp.]|uniref:bpX5 domain-containing protein n=1 Tax=Pseudomonas sp. TaxID=306 RepID=UPI003394C147
MTSAALIDWGWQPRAPGREPAAAVAWGDAAPRLLNRLAQMSGEEQARLQATANRDVLVVLGDACLLPWVQGIDYAAPCPQAPALWMPTRWQPNVPVDLLARAFSERYARLPLLLWHRPATCIPLDRQLPLSPELLTRIHAQWTGCRHATA